MGGRRPPELPRSRPLPETGRPDRAEVATLRTAAVPSGGSALGGPAAGVHHAIQLPGSALELMAEDDPRRTDITVRRAIAFSRLSHAVFEEGVRWQRDAEQL